MTEPATPTENRTLDSIVLPGDLSGQVRAMLDEWSQAEKLIRYGLTPRNRVLLHGPPGNGKTALATAIASELEMPMTLLRYSEVVGSHLGESEKNLAAAFRRGEGVMFFDECDALLNRRTTQDDSCAKARNATVNTILMELDQLPATTVVIFATNFADVLDPAFARRVNLTLEMPAPDVADLRRLHASLQRRHPLWPIADFDVGVCGARSFAVCEQMILEHARRKILDPDFDPLGIAGQPRSAWLRKQLAAQNTRELAMA